MIREDPRYCFGEIWGIHFFFKVVAQVPCLAVKSENGTADGNNDCDFIVDDLKIELDGFA
jgi:hypothetical protein